MKEFLPLNISEPESAELSLKTARSLWEYKNSLGVTDEDLKGKTILDLGSGPERQFAEEVEKSIPDTKVVSFDFSFDRPIEKSPTDGLDTRGFKDQEKKEVHADLSVQGLFTQLPFADESFDLVVSSAAMPFYLHSKAQIEKAFDEVIRVLRSGGSAHVGPIRYTDIISKDKTRAVQDTHEQHTEQETIDLLEDIFKKFKEEANIQFVFGDEYRPKKFRPNYIVVNKK